MTEDMHELMRTALLEPDGDPPVEELVRRGRTRRTRRRAALVVVPVLALVAGLLAVPGLFDERVQFAPAEPGAAAPGGWPVQVRYELVDLHYVETRQLPDEGGPVPLQISEFAGNSWDDWYGARVVQRDLDRSGWVGSPDGSPRPGVGEELGDTDHAAGVRRYVGGVGLSLMEDERVPADPDEPFATIRAVMDPTLEWDERLSTGVGRPLSPGPGFHAERGGYQELPGVRMLDEHIPEQHRGEWEDLRERVGGALELDPDDLSAVVYEEPFCFDPYAEGAACADRADAEWIRWTRVWHTATQIPLYAHWAEADWEDNPDALQVTMLRVTHIELTTNGTERPPVEPQAEPVTLELAPEVVAIGGHLEARYTNNTEEPLSHGAGWTLERWQDGDWAPAEPLPPDHEWPAVEYVLDPDETGRDVIPTDHLEPGRYRYTKVFNGGEISASAEFEVRDPQGSPQAESGEYRLAVSDQTIPREPGDVFADIVTDEDDYDRAWQRFGLESPGYNRLAIDFSQEALLFLGFGESGSCPARFDGLDVRGGDVHVAIGYEGDDQPEFDCNADYRPRTFVIAGPKGLLPERGFVLRAGDQGNFPLASTPQVEPPPEPPWIWGFGPHPEAEFVVEPSTVRRGEPVEVAIRNHGEHDAGWGDSPRLERWDRQRWLPAPGQPEYELHPAMTHPGFDRVPPGETGAALTVHTAGLTPGYYAVRARLAADGAHERRASFAVE